MRYPERVGFYLTEFEISMMKSGDWEGLSSHNRELEKKWASAARFNSMCFSVLIAVFVGSFFYFIAGSDVGVQKGQRYGLRLQNASYEKCFTRTDQQTSVGLFEGK